MGALQKTPLCWELQGKLNRHNACPVFPNEVNAARPDAAPGNGCVWKLPKFPLCPFQLRSSEVESRAPQGTPWSMLEPTGQLEAATLVDPTDGKCP